MADLQARFDAAVAQSKALIERPDNATLLKIYGLYKQATAGDNTDKNPVSAIWSDWPNGRLGPASKASRPRPPCSSTST